MRALTVLRAFAALTIASSAAASPVLSPAAVKAWEGTLELPTWGEGLPDVNPPFDAFETRRYNYPYTLREDLGHARAVVAWRALFLENEHLRCTVLPDLGGHLYDCVDKANGADMFYANPSIKKARVAYRGAWTALGIEFNFPVSHNWATVSPVDYAIERGADGSASVWVGNIDRVYGMQWRVALTLRPGRSVLEQQVTLYNRSDTRHRFYWWNNAGVRVWDDSRILYPMQFTASHGFRSIDTWPVNQAGVDLSVVGNHMFGPVSEFSHGSREPFMAVYHPRTKSGVAHYSSPLDAPTKKIWSWGGDADALDWRRALSDDDSAYVEVQAGLFRNQETYAFLEPQEEVRFTEYWMPVREIGGVTRATPDAVLELHRTPGAGGAVDLVAGVNVTRAITGTIEVKDGARMVRREALALTPAGAAMRTFAGLPAGPRYTVAVRDGAGVALVEHTEEGFDYAPASEIHLGPQPAPETPPPGRRSAADIVAVGTDQELNGKRLVAWDTYAEGRRLFPQSATLARAAGRLAVELGRFAEAAPLLEQALAFDTTDAEAQYNLGLADRALGRTRAARSAFEAAQHFRDFRAAARLQLAQMEAADGRLAAALDRLRGENGVAADAVRAGALEVALLRHLGRTEEARRALARWRAADPTSSALRVEAVRLGGADEALWAHLGADPARVLDLAVDAMGAGLWDDAIALLARTYPAPQGMTSEPGAVPPQDDPEIAYYRGYARERAGGSGRADYDAASRLSTRYVFPSRPTSYAVFESAIAANPKDATAHFLLGSLYLAGGRAVEAVQEWEEARRLDRTLPVLHRNLGRTLLLVRGDVDAALSVFLEGLTVDPRNPDLYQGADQALGLRGRPAAERIAALERYPDRAAMPPELRQRLALAYAEAGRADEAEALLAGGTYTREEQGTNVREVWIEVRLQRALALARAGRGADARAIVDGLDRAVPGVAFTTDGLGAFVQSARVQYEVGEILAAAGDEAAAREHWEQAAQGRGSFFRGAVYAHLAAARLGKDDAAARTRLAAALADSETFLARGTSFPGVVTYAQGLMLRALGREDEAREGFRRALLLPDQQLSHFLARRALLGTGPR